MGTTEQTEQICDGVIYCAAAQRVTLHSDIHYVQAQASAELQDLFSMSVNRVVIILACFGKTFFLMIK